MTMKCPFSVAFIPGKMCRNRYQKWHRMPNTHKEKCSTIIVQFDKKHSLLTAVFCYHCFLCWLGECAKDLEKIGATKTEIKQFVFGFKVLKGNTIK